MRILLLATLLAATAASAFATPTPPTPPGPPTDQTTQQPACKVSGDPIVVIDHAAIAGSKETTSVTKLYASRAWTYAETKPDGKPGPVAHGCLPQAKVTSVEDAIKAAPWTITHPKIHCMAMATTFVEYTIGKVKFTQKTCGTDILDDKSAAQLVEINKVIDAATAVVTPPCCKK